MAQPSNTRVYYAMEGVALGKMGTTSVEDTANPSGDGSLRVAHGMQSVGLTTNFNLEQIFELGQLSLYENIEDVPDIELTTEKVIDGYPLVYHMATPDAANPKLTGRSDSRTDFRMLIGDSTEDNVASGVDAISELYCSGLYLSALTYSFPTDGSFTENVTFVGNNKKWITSDSDGEAVLLDSGYVADSVFNFGSDSPEAAEGVQRRENISFDDLTFATFTGKTLLPQDVPNVNGDGSVTTDANGTPTTVHVQSINVSTDLGREQINQLGSKTPYFRYVDFPVEVTSEIEVIATEGDNVTALETQDNLSDRKIQIVCDDSTVLQLGTKNKISSISYGGADAGGGNATITYSYTNFNDLVVLHTGDPIEPVVGNAAYWKDHFA